MSIKKPNQKQRARLKRQAAERQQADSGIIHSIQGDSLPTRADSSISDARGPGAAEAPERPTDASGGEMSYPSDDQKYGVSGTIPRRREQRMEMRALRMGWIQPPTGKQIPVHVPNGELAKDLADRESELTLAELATSAVLEALKTGNKRDKGIAARTALAMIRTNMKDSRDEEELELKRAMVANAGGTVGETIPSGVVLLERPSATVDEWTDKVAEAAADPVTGQEVPEFVDDESES